MLYIDNPVEAGFSFTQSEDGYGTNQFDVDCDLFEALQQPFTLFNEYAQDDFYNTGELWVSHYENNLIPRILLTISLGHTVT